MVGGTGTDLFIFSPANVTANEGDVIMFTFSGQYVHITPPSPLL